MESKADQIVTLAHGRQGQSTSVIAAKHSMYSSLIFYPTCHLALHQTNLPTQAHGVMDTLLPKLLVYTRLVPVSRLPKAPHA